MNKQVQLALFLIRFGLGIFLLAWSIDKLVVPESTVKIFQIFYHIGISLQIAYVIGAFEVLLSLAILVGYQKTLSYGLGCLIHGVSTLSSFKQLLDPFGPNHLFIAGVPVLFSFIALFVARKYDTLWTIRSVWKKA